MVGKCRVGLVTSDVNKLLVSSCIQLVVVATCKLVLQLLYTSLLVLL